MQIKSLFDPKKDIYRTIEKVITYGASQETRLRAEIGEYIVTDHIEEQFEKLLRKMQDAMEQGGQNEVGVWVSGFYGSGKSSFTKYLGLALDDSVKVDGIRFLKHLQDRMKKATTRQILSTTAARFPAAVVMLDLASEMLAGATMVDVSTVLYYKVLQWAGYSRNLKVAALERRLQKEGRYEAFKERIQSELGVPWEAVQNDDLVTDSLLPDIAHQMLPELFKTPTAFSTSTNDIVRFENERVQEMIEIAREHSGKQYIIFIIDEVGQYVADRQNLILNLDGLAKNLKNIGDGKAWIIGTAQQTLTEDDPHAALNSPMLYKLKDRFPIQVDLEARDIKQICTERLLGKSPEGASELGRWFDRCGQELRYNTKLQDARYYDSNFDRETFINLYPFLPAHFDILLHLLGALAKSTGGIGLRSAIKILQDILIEAPSGGAGLRTPVAERPVGWLATTVTLYDALEKDIRRAKPELHNAVGKALKRFPDLPLHEEVCKTVAVLQILDNIPITVQNVAALSHPALDTTARRAEIDNAIQDLINDGLTPFGEQDGSLRFFSEKINEIDLERAGLIPRSIETRRLHSEALRDVFNPLPSTKLNGSLSITVGLKLAAGSLVSSLAGDRETLQLQVEFMDPSDYDSTRARLVDDSRGAKHTIFLLGRTSREVDDRLAEIYRCREIAVRHRSDPDQEVKTYCASQADRADGLSLELQRLLKNSLAQGSFVFRGQITAADSLDPDVQEAARKLLGSVAAQAYDRYREAPARVDTTAAEKFLKAGNLNAITGALDPLGLVVLIGGTARIQTKHKALVSILDEIRRSGSTDGKRLTDRFTDAPFGWSPDTLRYLMAALLAAGEIKLKVSGREVSVAGQQAIEGLRTNNSFKNVSIFLREEKTPVETLARAAERLTRLTGTTVLPYPEDEISKAAVRHFPQLQLRYGPLPEKLERLGLPGAEQVRSLNQDLADLLLSDASEAPQRLGGEESAMFEGLQWAAAVDRSLNDGLDKTLVDLRNSQKDIEALPEHGIPGRLRLDLQETFSQVSGRLNQKDFHRHAADLRSALTAIQSAAAEAARQMAIAQGETIHAAQEDLLRLTDWAELTQEEQSGMLADVENLSFAASDDLPGLKRLLNQEYIIAGRLGELKRRIAQTGAERRMQREEDARRSAGGRVGKILTKTQPVPAKITQPARLEALIGELQALQAELPAYERIDILLTLQEE